MPSSLPAHGPARRAFFQRSQQALESVGQRNGACGVGEHECARHQKCNAKHHENGVFDALLRNFENPELHQRLSRPVKQVQKRCQHNDQQQRLEALTITFR